MDPVSIFATVLILGMNWNIDKNAQMNEALQDHIVLLEQEIIDLEKKQEADFLTLAGKTSAIAAKQAVINQTHADQAKILSDSVNNLDQKLNYINEKITILHP